MRLRNALGECDGLALRMPGLGSTVFRSHLLGEGMGVGTTVIIYSKCQETELFDTT